MSALPSSKKSPEDLMYVPHTFHPIILNQSIKASPTIPPFLQGRPGTHDLMKNMLEALGYRVSKIRITSLKGSTYLARVHFSRGRGIKSATPDVAPSFTEIDIDARPSDAINLAIRFGAPIYVNREVAAEAARPSSFFDDREVSAGTSTGASVPSHADASASEIVRSCREEILHYSDPTIMHKLQLQLAIAEERFEDATKLRDVIDKLLASDRALSLVVAIETALEDQRFEEAARLRDEFRRLRMSHHAPQISDIIDL